jgi:hypothetical protein
MVCATFFDLIFIDVSAEQILSIIMSKVKPSKQQAESLLMLDAYWLLI